MENSTPAAKKIFAQKIANMGAEAENTLYIAEMFIAPEIHGSARGGNMIKLMLRQSLQWANANGFTNIMSWTPGEERGYNQSHNQHGEVLRLHSDLGERKR